VLRQDIVRLLIEELTATFGEVESAPQRVHVIRSAGTLDPATDWANELHPTGAGFQKLMQGPWRKRLKAAGFAS